MITINHHSVYIYIYHSVYIYIYRYAWVVLCFLSTGIPTKDETVKTTCTLRFQGKLMFFALITVSNIWQRKNPVYSCRAL